MEIMRVVIGYVKCQIQHLYNENSKTDEEAEPWFLYGYNEPKFFITALNPLKKHTFILNQFHKTYYISVVVFRECALPVGEFKFAVRSL